MSKTIIINPVRYCSKLYVAILLTIIVVFLTTITRSVFALDDNKGFVENKGQILNQDLQFNRDVLFFFSQGRFNFYLRKNGFSYQWAEAADRNQFAGICHGNKCFLDNICQQEQEGVKLKIHRVDVFFEKINDDVKIRGSHLLPGKTNYYTAGLKEKGIIGARSFRRVYYHNIYDGIDVEFLIDENSGLSHVKYNFIIHPGADSNRILMRYEGIDSISANNNKNPNLKWGTYFGGELNDYVFSTSVDKDDNVIIAGHTLSSLNIATSGAHQTTIDTDYDCFVAKFDKNGNRKWSTYYGGSANDRSYCAGIDTNGNIFLGGSTFSTNNIATGGAYQTSLQSVDDAFLVKFDSAGIRQWCTYFGGNDHDFFGALDIAENGDVYITGHTRSINNIATPGAHQTTFMGIETAMITLFSNSGAFLWGTYYGGGFDAGWGIAVDDTMNFYIAGATSSDSLISTQNSHQPALAGSRNAFLVKFDSTGTRLWATYYGGEGIDKGEGLALDNNGGVYLGGSTEISSFNIATAGAHQSVKGSVNDAFLIKFNTSGARQWGTYYGGNSVEYGFGVVAGTKNDIYLTGLTESTNNIATISGYQTYIAGMFDAYLVKFDSDGIRKWGTYFGGSASDESRAVSIDSESNLYLAGNTKSLDSIATTGSHQPVYGGGMNDAFLAKLCNPPSPQIILTDSTGFCLGEDIFLQTDTGFFIYEWSDGQNESNIYVSHQSPGDYYYWVMVIDSAGCLGFSDSIVMSIYPLPEVNLGNDTAICDTASLMLNAGPGFTSYAWSDGATDSVLIVDGQNLIAGINLFAVLVEDTNGCIKTDTIAITLNICTGINDKFDYHELEITPNPAYDILHLTADWLKNSGVINVYDICGRIIQTVDVKEQPMKINISRLDNGIYFIEVKTEKVNIRKKIVKL